MISSAYSLANLCISRLSSEIWCLLSVLILLYGSRVSARHHVCSGTVPHTILNPSISLISYLRDVMKAHDEASLCYDVDVELAHLAGFLDMPKYIAIKPPTVMYQL